MNLKIDDMLLKRGVVDDRTLRHVLSIIHAHTLTSLDGIAFIYKSFTIIDSDVSTVTDVE